MLRFHPDGNRSESSKRQKRVRLILMQQSVRQGVRCDRGHDALPFLSPKPPSLIVRETEADGLIVREVYPQVPPKVEYSLSPLGRSMEPVLLALKIWSDANIDLFGQPDSSNEIAI
jgi:DNA-binding HxlR family transcriptional regulator